MDKKEYYNNIRLSLTDEDIIKIFNNLGVTNYINKKDYLIFPTICHNSNIEEASYKLYYYKKNKLFHCYTECGDSFDIFQLLKRYYEVRNIKYNFHTNILDLIGIKQTAVINDFEKFEYKSEKEKYQPKERTELKKYSNTILTQFIPYHAAEWINEGITDNVMNKFNILYSIEQNKIIIPHYDINNNLIGIRARALNPEDILKGKYMPIIINNKVYSHPLSMNLYGLNITKNNILNNKYVVVFEGEKSVLLMESYFPNNCSVATCGSNFHKTQLDLLLKLGVNEIIIAFDKENTTKENSEKYFDKLNNICQKYKKYCNFSFIYDRENLLDDKDSPIDKGKEIFMQLLQRRVVVF